MSLYENIRKISANLGQQRHLIKSTEAAKHVSDQPFIQSLGYDLSKLNEVLPGFVGADGWTCDYAIVVDNEPKILVKVTTDLLSPGIGYTKELSRHLGPPTHRICIITDGVQYRLYAPVNDMKTVHVEMVMSIDLIDLDESALENLEHLSKQAFNPRMIVHYATNIKQKNRIRTILEANYRQPSKEFVRFFAAEIHGGIIPIGFVDALAPLVKQIFRDFVEERHEMPSRPRTRAPEDKVEIPVYASWHGNEFSATLCFYESQHSKSRVTFHGLSAAPSNAALKAIRSVVRDFKAINGWTFWKLRDPSGNRERPISDLRDDGALLRRLLGNT